MSLEKCRGEIRDAAGKNLSDDDIDRIIASVRSHGQTRGGDFARAAKELSAFDQKIAEQKKLEAAQNLAKRGALVGAVDEHRAQGLSFENAIDAQTRGINTPVKGARASTAAAQLARQNQFIKGLTGALDKESLMPAWQKRTMTNDWVKELFELRSKDGKPGVTGNPMALRIAKAVQSAQEVARLQLNRSGAWIGDYAGYISRTLHDAHKIFRAGYEPWRDYTLERLDTARTFGDSANDPNAVERIMQGLYQDFATGNHMSSAKGLEDKNPFAIGTNTAKQLSEHRELHWKDADAWREYQEKFADPVIERGVMESLLRAGSDSELMARWGSNPQATFDGLMDTIKTKNKSDIPAMLAFQKAEPRLRREFDILTGKNNIPTNKLSAQISGGIRAWQDIAKLGSVLLTHLSVLSTKPYQLRYHGMGRWQAYSSTIRNLMQDKSPEALQTIENLHANASGQAHNILSGYEPIDSVPGHIAQLRAMSIRMGGLPWMLNRQKMGTQWELSNFLGQRVGQTFDQLHPKLQRVLKIYGIDKPEWDVLRNAPDHDKNGVGSTFLTPKAAERAPDSAIDTLTRGRITAKTSAAEADRIRAQTRDSLGMALSSYFSDSADRSTITPGIPERAIFARAGELGPIVGQYKTWAAAAVRQMWGQAIYGSSSKAEMVKTLAGLVASSTAIGYFVHSAKDAIRGKVPQQFTAAQQIYDPLLGQKAPKLDLAHDVNLLAASMAQGGGMGIWGDFLLGQLEDTAGTGRERASRALDTLAGPVIGDVVRTGGIGLDYLTSAIQKHPGKALGNANAETIHELIDNLPAVNTWYLRGIMNYLLLDRLQNMASPGYVQRYRNKIKQQSGQTFWMPPGIGAH